MVYNSNNSKKSMTALCHLRIWMRLRIVIVNVIVIVIVIVTVTLSTLP